MSPRSARDIEAITVHVTTCDVGYGTAAEGGGPLRGGLTLTNRVTAEIDDPAVPYDITLTIAARDGWLVPESVTVSERPDGPVMTSAAVRALGLSLYVTRIRTELEDSLFILKPAGSGEGWRAFDMPADADWDSLSIAQIRRAARANRITPAIAAEAYRTALASPDPGQSRRPTAAAAEKLGVSRGYISGLLTQARQQGIEGLGEGRPSRRKDGAK